MDRRSTWLPLTLVALLAGGALAPHLVTTGGPPAPGRAADPAPSQPPSSPDATVGNAGFVGQLAQLLNIDIGELALVRDASRRASGTPRFDDAEMIRCFFDLDLDGDVEFDRASREVAAVWPQCGRDRTPFATALPDATLAVVRRVLARAESLHDARARSERRDETVASSVQRAAALVRSDTLTRAVIDEAAAAARRRMAFLAVRRAAGCRFRAAAAASSECAPDEREFVQFVIATVPDPVDSYARWQFDPTLMTLTEAATADGYLPTRFYFPDTTTPPASAVRGSTPLHERIPGVLLLRQDERAGGTTTHKLLVMLLAYETATAGVHPAALAAAMRIVIDWHRSDPPASGGAAAVDPVLMLAPTFSGSSESIAAVIDALKTDLAGRPVRIVSGSANAPGNYLTLNRPPLSRFAATVYPNKVLFDVLWQYLSTVVDPGLADSHSVVWLAESNTTYGRAFTAGLPGDPNQVDHLIRFFPLHLSRIQPHETPPPQNGATGRFGPLNIEDSARFTDQIPLVSDNTTRSYVELTLAHTIRSIKDARVRFVGLVATDARDKLFLAREVLRETPNVILFTTESDILYSHPDMYAFTGGMLLATPYPLDASRPLVNRRRGEERRALPESTMVGVYNALLLLLNYDEEGRPTKADAPGLLRYANSSCKDDPYRPDVWISMVGRDAPRPIWRACPALNYRTNTSQQLAADTAVAIERYTQRLHPAAVNDLGLTQSEPRIAVGAGIRVMLMLCTVLMFGQAIVALYVADGGRDTFTLLPYFAVGCVALVPVALLVAGFGELWLREPSLDAQLNVVIAPAAACALLMLVAAAVLSIASADRGLRERAWWGAAAALALMTSQLVRFLAAQRSVSTLFVDRIAQWNDGTSPLLAIAALALAVYAWPVVEYVRWWRRPPFGDGVIEYLGQLVGLDQSAPLPQLACFNAPIVSLTGRAAGGVALFGLALVLFGFDPIVRPLIAVDGRALGRYMTIGMLTAEIIIVVAVTQFVCLWQSLSQLLDRVAAAGYADSFRALPDKLFPTGAVPRTPRLRDLDVSLDIWKRLAALRGRVDRGDLLQKTFGEELSRNPRQMLSRTDSWPALLRCASGAAAEVRLERAGRRTDHPAVTVVPIGPAADPINLVIGLEMNRFVDAETERRASENERADRERFAVVPLVLFLRMALARMWDNLALAAASIGLLAIALWAYRLQMNDALVSILWCDVIAAAAVVLYVFVQMERNELLSHITSTRPGEIDWDRSFLTKLVVYGLVPLAGLFATQFPNLSGTLVRWLEPVQKALP